MLQALRWWVKSCANLKKNNAISITNDANKFGVRSQIFVATKANTGFHLCLWAYLLWLKDEVLWWRTRLTVSESVRRRACNLSPFLFAVAYRNSITRSRAFQCLHNASKFGRQMARDSLKFLWCSDENFVTSHSKMQSRRHWIPVYPMVQLESVRVAPRQMYSRQHSAFDQDQVIWWPWTWDFFWKLWAHVAEMSTKPRTEMFIFGMRGRNVYESHTKAEMLKFTAAFGGRNVEGGCRA